ncbi:MAG: O-antigen polymerase [Mycobacterium sp.]
MVETLAVLGLFTVYLVVPTGANTAVIWTCLAVQYVVLAASLGRPVTVRPGLSSWVTTEFLFLFLAYLIFFYPYQLHVLGIYDVSDSTFFRDSFAEQSNHAILLSAMAVVGFRAGLRVLRMPEPTAVAAEQPTNRLDRVTVQALVLPVFVLQSIFIGAYLASGMRASGEARYSRADLATVVASPLVEGLYWAIVVLCMVSVALWILPASHTATQVSAILSLSALISGCWGLRLLINGDRNAFLLIALVAVAGFVTFRVRVGRWVLVLLGVGAMAMYHVVEAFRAGRINSWDEFVQGMLGNTAASTYNGDTAFNISTVSVRAVIAGVPDLIDYGYGLFKLIGVGGVIPFIRGLILPRDVTYTQSSQVVSELLLGSNPRWGVGSNVIADVYIDFGAAAVPVLLFALGLFVAYVQRGVVRQPDSPWRGVLYLITLAFIAETPRYTIDFSVRALVWVTALFWVVSMLPTGWRGRARGTTPPSAPDRPSG